MDIAGKTILITGANRGIGRALLDEALRRGAKRVYAGTRGMLSVADERVTAIQLDVTNAADIERAAREVPELDVLVNNAGLARFDDLASLDVIAQHLAVNFLGSFNVARAFLPHLVRSRGAIVNNLSLAALAPMPIIPAYSISKAAAHSMTQALRLFLAARGVTVHAIFLGPVDTDMTRDFDIPKATPESVARAIFDAFARGEEDIFPDPVSQPIADGWRRGVAKALERDFAAFLPPTG